MTQQKNKQTNKISIRLEVSARHGEARRFEQWNCIMGYDVYCTLSKPTLEDGILKFTDYQQFGPYGFSAVDDDREYGKIYGHDFDSCLLGTMDLQKVNKINKTICELTKIKKVDITDFIHKNDSAFLKFKNELMRDLKCEDILQVCAPSWCPYDTWNEIRSRLARDIFCEYSGLFAKDESNEEKE